MIHVQCPRCQTRFTTSDANLGKTGQCPKCGNPIKVQASAPPPAGPSGGGATDGGPATAGPSPETGAAPDSAVADSALGAARRHAAEASASGDSQAEAPAPPPTETQAAPAPQAEPRPAGPPADETAALPRGKSKTVALLLCIFLGAFGIHRFYMGSWGWGLVILGLSLTCVGGAVFALVDIIRLAVMDKADFQDRYSETVVQPFTF